MCTSITGIVIQCTCTLVVRTWLITCCPSWLVDYFVQLIIIMQHFLIPLFSMYLSLLIHVCYFVCPSFTFSSLLCAIISIVSHLLYVLHNMWIFWAINSYSYSLFWAISSWVHCSSTYRSPYAGELQKIITHPELFWQVRLLCFKFQNKNCSKIFTYLLLILFCLR